MTRRSRLTAGLLVVVLLPPAVGVVLLLRGVTTLDDREYVTLLSLLFAVSALGVFVAYGLAREAARPVVGEPLWRRLALLGDTLSSTHDLNRILSVILDTSVAASSAKSGAIFLANGRELQAKAVRGLAIEPAQLRVRRGEGIVGRVAASGEPLRGRPSAGGPQPASGEPRASTWIAIPFRSSGRTLGVLALYDREDGGEFDESDQFTIRTFASQAAVAVENVLLHEDARRLSLTDPLTGLWNYRYFQLRFTREIERAARFARPLAVMMLDVDRFKWVNDTYGHPRGDSVLVELSRRVQTQIRDVDVLARYGGEELVLILPETGEDGARTAAERICAAVRADPVLTDDDPTGGVAVTVSIGVAVFPIHGTTASELLSQADEALYAAKSAGRDTWRMAERNGITV